MKMTRKDVIKLLEVVNLNRSIVEESIDEQMDCLDNFEINNAKDEHEWKEKKESLENEFDSLEHYDYLISVLHEELKEFAR